MKKISLFIIAFVWNFALSRWTTNGSNIYFNSGNVGIGTTAPLRKFDVKLVTNTGTLK